MNRRIQRKQGISLILVLAIMLAATVMATAVYYSIMHYNKRSGEDLYAATAVSASKAGAASIQSWLTYEGAQTVNLIQTFLDPTVNPLPRKPIEISLSSDYTMTANSQNQSYRVYLVDVVADPTNSGAPIAAKFQINAVGQDGATSVSTVMFDLTGIGFQKPKPINTTGVGTMPLQDAIFVGGTFTGSTNVTTEGSAYFESSTNLNIGSRVKGNLVIGPGTSCISISGGSAAGTTVDGDFYSGTPLNLNSTTLIKGNAYLAGICGSGSFPITFSQDAYFAGSVMNVDQGASKLWIKRNAYFEDSLQFHGSAVQIDGDVNFGPSSHIWDKDANSRPNFVLNGRVLMHGDFVIGTGSTSPQTVSFGGSNWAYVNSIVPATDSNKINWNTIPAHKIGAPALWGTDTNLTMPDTLKTVRAQLNSGSKPTPIQMDSNQINAKVMTFSSLLTLYNSCKTGSHTSPYVDELECIYGKVSTLTPNKLLGGYLVIDLNSAGISFLDGTSQPASLTQKYVFVNPGTLGAIKQTPTTTDARVVFYYKSAGTYTINPVTSTADTCFCMFYTASGVTISTQGSNAMVIEGSLVSAPGSTFNATLGYTFVYNNQVLNDLASGGFVDDAAGNNLANATSGTYGAPATISLLSPRLKVNLANMIFGPTTMDSTNVLMTWGRSLILSPTVISVVAGQFADWSAFAASANIGAHIKPDNQAVGCTAPSPLSTSGIDFSIPDRHYNVVYSATCTGGTPTTPTANLVLYVSPVPSGTSAGASSVVSSSMSSTLSSSSVALSSSTALSSSVASSSSVVMGPGRFPYTFEDGTTLDWSSTNGSVAIENTTFHSGSHSLKAIQNGAWAQVQANFSLETWAGYDSIVFWVFTPNAGQSTQVFWNTSIGGWKQWGSTLPMTQNAWTRLCWPLNGTGSITSVSSVGLNIANAGTYYIDDVSLVKAATSSSSTAVSSSSSSVVVSSSSNTAPYGGACALVRNSVVVGALDTAYTSTTWSDATNPGVQTIQFNFGDGSGWSTTATHSWSTTTGSPFTVQSRCTDADGGVSTSATCGSVTVTAVSSSSVAASSSSVAASSSSSWPSWCPSGCQTAPALAQNVNSGNFGTTGDVWYKVCSTINGWQFSNGAGRSVYVNNNLEAAAASLSGVTQLSGCYYFHFTAGTYTYAAWSWW